MALACLLLTAAGAAAGGACAAGKTEGWTRVVTGGLTDSKKLGSRRASR